MDIVDLSIDDPAESKITNAKKGKEIRKMFNELKKYVPFLKYIFDLDPSTNSKYKKLIDWIKTRHPSTLERWHVRSCESTIRKIYEKLKNATNFPTHIIEIFEGGISIVISDDDDSAQASTSQIHTKEDNVRNDIEQTNKNTITKQQNSTSISQRLENSKAQTESKNKDETLSSTRRKREERKNKLETNSRSERSSKSERSKSVRESSNEKKDTNRKTVDASAFDIVSWNDLEKEDGKSPVIENSSPKAPSARTYPLLPKNDINTEFDQKKKKKRYKHSPKKTDKEHSKIANNSFESLIKKRNELKKLLVDESKITPSNNDNCIFEKPRDFDLFQRRPSTMCERKKSFVDSSILDSVKSVLTKNPEVIAEVVNDTLGTKIVYDYTNVTTKISISKIIPVKNTEIIKSRGNDCTITKNVNDIENITSTKTTETNNNYTSGDAYRKAMYEQQIELQESMQQSPQKQLESSLLHQQKKRSMIRNYDVNRNIMLNSKQDTLENSSSNNKKSQKTSGSTQPRSSISKSSSKSHGDHKLTSDQAIHKQLKPLQSTDFDTNTKNLSSNEIRIKTCENKTKQTNSFESKQKHKEGDDLVVMSFPGRPKFKHRIESESSLEDFVPDMIKVHSSSSAKEVKNDGVPVKSKADEKSKLKSSSLNAKNSKDCDNKSSKSKPISVSASNEIKMPNLFNKDEPKKTSEQKNKKPKQDSVSTSLKNTGVTSKTDDIITKPKNNSDKKPIISDSKARDKKGKSESKKNHGKPEKRKNSTNPDTDSCSKQKLLKVEVISKKIEVEKTDDCLHIYPINSSEQREIKNKNNSNKSTEKSIKKRHKSITKQKDPKGNNSIQSTTTINKRPEKKTKISTPPDNQLILTQNKYISSPVVSLSLELNNKTFDKEEELKQRKLKTITASKSKDNSHKIPKDLKRKPPVESSQEINNHSPMKKSKISTQLNKNTTPKKSTTNTSPAKRFYRELNNLTCTFKESLLPQTIGRRRCSSSWLNFSENVAQKSKNINTDLTPAPIKLRRQTCCTMPTLKLTLQRSTDRSDEYHIKGVENDRSSDETDEFDIDEHRGINQEMSNPDISTKEVNSSTNNSLTTMDSSPHKEMPRLIPFDSIPTTPTLLLGNNDSKMTFKSTRTCVLCDKNSNDLTNHYVVKHKTESYVSRLSATDIQGLEKETNVAIPVCRNRYKMTCVFCKQMIEDHFENFYAHFSYHTGEYNFQCEGCKIKKPYKEDIGSHQLRSRICRNSKIIKVHHNELEKIIVHLHICKICNFVNLNELNLKNHLRKQHGLMSNELQHSNKCILLVKDVRQIEKEVTPVGLDGNKGDTPAEEEAPLCAEKDFLSELPMNIQHIIMDEDNLVNGLMKPNEKSIADVSKAIINQKSDTTVQADRDETEASTMSPEELLEEMHAPNNEKITNTTFFFGKSTYSIDETVAGDSHAEDNPNRSVPDIYNSNEVSNCTIKRIFDDLRTPETTLVVPSNDKPVVENQNDSDIIINIEKHIISTKFLCQSPKRRDTHDCDSSKPVVDSSRKEHNLQSPFERNLEKIPALSISNDKESSQCLDNSLEEIFDLESLNSSEEHIEDSIERHFEDLESVTSIEEHVRSPNKIVFRRSERQIPIVKSPSKNSCNISGEISLVKLVPAEDCESLTSIEAYIESTNEKQSSKGREQDISPKNNSMLIINNSSEQISKSPENELSKLNASKISNETSLQSLDKLVDGLNDSVHLLVEKFTQTQVCNKTLPHSFSSTEQQIDPSNAQYRDSMIYQRYDKLDAINFGLFKCLKEDCLYSTNSEEEFKLHCSNHNQTEILDCPYCFTKSSCFENLTHHIWLEHSMSNYQCAKCSYRSMIPGNVIIHSKICHSDIKSDESIIYKCDYLIMATESKCKTMPEKIRNNKASLKCPDCSYCFFSMTSIKPHLQQSHPLTFQRFSSLNFNELACIHCKKVSNCKEKMQIHLALQHPDEPAFVIERNLKPMDCEDEVEDDLMVVDISIDVINSDIKIVGASESLNTDNSIEDQETVTNSRVDTLMPLDYTTKSYRSPDKCTTINHPADDIPTNSRTMISPIEKTDSSEKLKKIEQTPQTRENCSADLSESVVNAHICEAQLNTQSKTLQDIEKLKNIDIHPIMNQDPEHLQVQSPNDSCELLQPVSHHENKILETPFDTTSDDLSKALAKEGERIKLLLEQLVENTGVHSSSLYRCPQCNSSFMHFNLWVLHIKNKHNSMEENLNCPYCSKPLKLESAESHFKNHLRHEYICYYCIESCCSKEKIREHFASCHDNCNTIEWPISTFYLVIKQDAIISDYTALLEHFAETIYLQLIQKIQRNTINEWTAAETSYLEEMEIPKYKPLEQPLLKCFVQFCNFVASDENSFDEHLDRHELPKTFKCTYCKFFVEYPSWKIMKCHNLQHLSSKVYVCCVCKFVHYNIDVIIKHIENLHNNRDVPVLCLDRSNLNYKMSLSICLPPNKISFATSKACFCCAQKQRNSNKFVDHLKKVHKISLCPRCQLCGKIILTQIDGEVHYKEHHQMDSFKLKYEVLTTYLYNLILTSRSPLAMEVHLKKEKCSAQQTESKPVESSSVTVKEETLVKSELEEDKETQSISIKCLQTNELLENRSGTDGNTFLHAHQSNEMIANLRQHQLQTSFVQQDVQHPTGNLIIENSSLLTDAPQNIELSSQHQQIVGITTSTSSQEQVQLHTTTSTFPHSQPLMNTVIQHPTGNLIIEKSSLLTDAPQNMELSSQHQQIVGITTSSQEQVQLHTTTSTIRHSQPLMNTVIQYSSRQQAITTEVPAVAPHLTTARSSIPVLSPNSQNRVSTEIPLPNCSLPNHEPPSAAASRHTQHVVIQQIQLTTGNAILSIPIESSTAGQHLRTVEEPHRIPVITTRVSQPNIEEIASPPANIPLIPSNTRSLSNTSVQANRVHKPNLDEIAPICGICHFECIDFIHLQAHYEATHAIYNQGFYFYVDRKIGCTYCQYQGIVSSFAKHHTSFHPDRIKQCYNVIDRVRCGICNERFRYPLSATRYSSTSLCACPAEHQRSLADCLNLPILNTLQYIGYQYKKYSCDVCRLSFKFPQHFCQHYFIVHQQFIDPQVLSTKFEYYCCMCPSFVSYKITEVINHMRVVHLLPLRITFLERFGFYKSIRIAYPNGFLVSLNDLRNTGQFDEERFKQSIYNLEGSYIALDSAHIK